MPRLSILRLSRWKWKPEYVDSLSESIDVVIVGGWRGTSGSFHHSHAQHRFRQGKISHFIVAVKDTDEAGDTIYRTIGKIGSGYTWAELKEMDERLQKGWKWVEPPEVFYSTRPRPDCGNGAERFSAPNVRYGAKVEKKCIPHYWIEPKDSLVLEVKCAEFTPASAMTAAYDTGFTFR